MPTAGKAAGAVLFALLAFAVSAMVAGDLPINVSRGWAPVVAGVVGALCGWRIAGRVSAGPVAAAARGMTAALVTTFWTLLFGAMAEMLRRSLRGLYDDPTEALGDMMQLGADYARVLAEPAPLAVLLLGGMAAGVVAGAVARRLP